MRSTVSTKVSVAIPADMARGKYGVLKFAAWLAYGEFAVLNQIQW